MKGKRTQYTALALGLWNILSSAIPVLVPLQGVGNAILVSIGAYFLGEKINGLKTDGVAVVPKSAPGPYSNTGK